MARNESSVWIWWTLQATLPVQQHACRTPVSNWELTASCHLRLHTCATRGNFVWVAGAGQEGFEGIRGCCYPGTNLFLIAYKTDSTLSLNNLRRKWHDELVADLDFNKGDDRLRPDHTEPWYILVGCQVRLTQLSPCSEHHALVQSAHTHNPNPSQQISKSDQPKAQRVISTAF